jgi:hypothetical protein
MLQLFQSIFGLGNPEAGSYPEEIVQMAIERAVDGTDARLRALPGYQKRLRPAVLRAIDHVVPLVDGLPSSVELSAESYREDPRLRVFFASVEHLRQVLREDGTLRDFLQGPAATGVNEIHALLMMVRRERKVLGMELQGERVRREVAQVTVSFSAHRLLDLTADPEETTRLLRRRVFDHLLEIALGQIGSRREERADLKHQHDLLRRKLSTLESGNWGFGAAAGDVEHDPDVLEQRIGKIEQQLQELGADSGVLEAHLEILIDVLQRAPEQVRSTTVTEHLDSMGIRREPGTASALTLELLELRSILGRTAIPLRVTIPRSEFPERGDFLAEAQRYLG